MSKKSRMREALEAIRDYTPYEVVFDEFAYLRMVESYRKAARAGLGEPDPACKRCGAIDVEIIGGICGTCGDDLRQEAEAVEAAARWAAQS